MGCVLSLSSVFYTPIKYDVKFSIFPSLSTRSVHFPRCTLRCIHAKTCADYMFRSISLFPFVNYKNETMQGCVRWFSQCLLRMNLCEGICNIIKGMVGEGYGKMKGWKVIENIFPKEFQRILKCMNNINLTYLHF